ncbi:YncE family protein [Phycisphaerales bacterium AB-hyl4]|uniref:YncE family protein n=1 Tax=Natronomicrosphaera hydrolytica TaxID=3242702 RepID=A0ABV4U2M1_9BACT
MSRYRFHMSPGGAFRMSAGGARGVLVKPAFSARLFYIKVGASVQWALADASASAFHCALDEESNPYTAKAFPNLIQRYERGEATTVWSEEDDDVGGLIRYHDNRLYSRSDFHLSAWDLDGLKLWDAPQESTSGSTYFDVASSRIWQVRKIGTSNARLEEYNLSGGIVNVGDNFTFGGGAVEYVHYAGGAVYVLNSSSSTSRVIRLDLSGNDTWNETFSGNLNGIVLGPSGELLVGSSSNNSILRLNASSGSEIGSVSMPGSVMKLARDGSDVYAGLRTSMSQPVSVVRLNSSLDITWDWETPRTGSGTNPPIALAAHGGFLLMRMANNSDQWSWDAS